MLQKFAPAEDQAYAKKTIDLLRQHRLDEIEKLADPGIAGPTLHETLVKMAAAMPAGEPSSITLIGAQTMFSKDTSTINLTYQYGFSGKWILTNVAVSKRPAGASIIGFSVVPQPASLEEQNKFTLGGKAPLHYIVLAFSVILLLFTLYALVRCASTKLKGRKWPWILFILFGFGKLAVNWTTGQWAIQPLSLQLFSASAFAPLYGPWTLAISFPLGAILFLAKRKQLAASPVAA